MPAGQLRQQRTQTLARRKQVRALNLKAIGYTYEAIAQSLLPCDDHRPNGRQDCTYCQPMYSDRSAARKAVLAGMQAEYAIGAETRSQYVAQQLLQIDMVLTRAMPEALDRSNPDRNEAARVAERFLRQRARLLGLEAPARIQITTELDETIRELVDQLEGAEA